ncbi:MAG: YdcH family protein [Vicinamibacterales bacterium]
MSAADAQEVKNLLLQSDDTYRQLVNRHQELDSRLHELSAKHYLTSTERVEEVTLKKRKLAVKDQMEAIARQFRGTRAS